MTVFLGDQFVSLTLLDRELPEGACFLDLVGGILENLDWSWSTVVNLGVRKNGWKCEGWGNGQINFCKWIGWGFDA